MSCSLRVVGLLILTTVVAAAGDAPTQPQTREQAEAIVATLKQQTGTIPLHDGLATLRVPETMRFLDSQDAATILVKLWGNPAQSVPLGMLVPANCDLLTDCWAVIITWEEDGYIKDDEAGKLDYGELLTQMKKDTRSANKERQKQGYPPVELVGWATTPRYDRDSHKLYWAKDLKFEGETQNTLNYNIRMLGRRGVLVLNAVAATSQLQDIETATPTLLAAVDFNDGHRYTDFTAAAGDKVASYGIGTLIAGGVAAKLGFFKGLWVLLLGAKKFVIIAVIAIGAWLRKFFGAKAAPASPASE